MKPKYTKTNAPHIINDYRLQREVLKGTNHDRIMQRKINRESMRVKV